MSRYIDADKLKARLDIVSVDAITLYEMGINAGLHRAEAEIEMLPTADVVEVVRCKDCKYWDARDSKGIQGICLCGEKDFYYGSEFYPFAEDFCSYAERREE